MSEFIDAEAVGPATAPGRRAPVGDNGDSASATEYLVGLFKREYRKLVAYVTYVVGDPGEAEDAVQDTFIDALREPERIVNASNPRAYLRTMARNRALDLASRRRRAVLVPELPEEQIANFESEIVAAQTLGERVQHVLAAIEQMPPQVRQVMTMAAWELEPKEIAVRLGMNEATVRSQLRHGRRRLGGVISSPEL